MQITTTLVELDASRSGRSAKGPWVLSVFQDEAGAKFQTFNKGLASKAKSLMQSPAVITYDEESNGDFINNVIKEIEEAPEGAVPTPAAERKGSVAPVDKRSSQQMMRTDALEDAIAIFTVEAQYHSDPEHPFTIIGRLDELTELADYLFGYIEMGNEPAELPA